MPYLPKAVANYREANQGAKKTCGSCIMFREPDRCTLVIGAIRKEDVCDEWEPKK